MFSPEAILEATASNKSFSKEIPGLQLAWDSTSLKAFRTCPRKYLYEIIFGYRTKKEKIALEFGILYHKGLEDYDKYLHKGADHEEAVNAITLQMLKATADPTHILNNSDDNRRTRETLLRTIIWYLDQFEKDVISTVIIGDVPAVELSFKFESPHESPDGEKYLLAGHLDKLGLFDDAPYVIDRKTTGSTISSYYYKQFAPNTQMSLYNIAGQVILGEPIKGVIIDAAQLAVNFSRFHRGFVHKTPTQDEEWLNDLRYTFAEAEMYASECHWPMSDSDSSCGAYGGCPFRDVCSRDQKVRDVFLQADYVIQKWDPLESRI